MIQRNSTLLNLNDQNKSRWLTSHENEHQIIFNYLNTLFANSVNNNYSFQGQQTQYATISSSLVFTGTGVILTPQNSGIIEIKLDARIENNAAGDSTLLNINYTPGTTLIGGGNTATGISVLPATLIYTSLIANQVFESHIDYLITGLTLKTSYIFQPIIEANGGGTAFFTQINMWVKEI